MIFQWFILLKCIIQISQCISCGCFDCIRTKRSLRMSDRCYSRCVLSLFRNSLRYTRWIIFLRTTMIINCWFSSWSFQWWMSDISRRSNSWLSISRFCWPRKLPWTIFWLQVITIQLTKSFLSIYKVLITAKTHLFWVWMFTARMDINGRNTFSS